ncbi:MAG: preprotein translocase subunit SecY [Phycisphaerales bacterium]|nr:MAG: preprotein translocase subunit SecY [Phycisphaerales bacterium]
MLQAFLNIFRIPDLRNKVLFTLGMLAVYRIGFWIPLPGVDQSELQDFMLRQVQDGGAAGRMAQFVAIFSGGSFSQSTIFGLGVMPYISAAIIFQLVASVSTTLKRLQREGPTGRQKIQEWTRYATVGLCVVQAFGWLVFITGSNLVYPEWANNPLWWVSSITAMTAGTVFLMWLGEQIDRFGIGNGVSLIITAGILTGMPGAVQWVAANFDPADTDKMGWMGVLLLTGGFVFVIAGAILITVAQRRIPVQQAKHTRGRRVFGGQRSYLPLRVNHGGVMPLIFASSLMIFPSVAFGYFADSAAQAGAALWWVNTARWMAENFQIGEYPYVVIEVALIFFFSYFWTTVQFNPEDMSKQLRDSGTFIPGIRPGPRTEEYLNTVMERVTYVGAAFLCVVAVIPIVVFRAFNVPFFVAAFLGGTGLLIVVSVGLDLIQRIEASLLMRNYAGFLGGNTEGKGPRIRGPRSM